MLRLCKNGWRRSSCHSLGGWSVRRCRCRTYLYNSLKRCNYKQWRTHHP
jgi:hypothetical protein